MRVWPQEYRKSFNHVGLVVPCSFETGTRISVGTWPYAKIVTPWLGFEEHPQMSTKLAWLNNLECSWNLFSQTYEKGLNSPSCKCLSASYTPLHKTPLTAGFWGTPGLDCGYLSIQDWCLMTNFVIPSHQTIWCCQLWISMKSFFVMKTPRDTIHFHDNWHFHFLTVLLWRTRLCPLNLLVLIYLEYSWDLSSHISEKGLSICLSKIGS